MSEFAAPGGRFVIEGGSQITGEMIPAGNKNEALPVLAAALLFPGETVIERVPRIADVSAILEILSRLGVRVSFESEDSVAIDSSNLKHHDPDRRLCSEIRGSFLLAPGLLHRTGKAVLPRPGGDRIGRRRVDTHLLALKALGAEVDARDSEYRITLPEGRFRGAEVFLDEASVMATENAVMAASVAEGESRIMNAACEPHVQGLCRLLASMGVPISGIGTNFIEVIGSTDLKPCRHRIAPDHIEIGSFLAIAAMTHGSLRIPDVRMDDLRMIRMVFRRLGVETVAEGNDLVMPSSQDLVVIEDLHGAVPKVDDAPWPGFPADLTSMALVLATQAKGTVLIHEKMFESRLFFVDKLIAMGARIVLCDPHRALVVGPSALHGSVMASPDIRAGMALMAAAMCAEGTSTIMNAHQVDRGYENIDERLRSLGAKITRVSS
jgi:UDP-N-acetylglucosamine 1-carboxyvinyltransferase